MTRFAGLLFDRVSLLHFTQDMDLDKIEIVCDDLKSDLLKHSTPLHVMAVQPRPILVISDANYSNSRSLYDSLLKFPLMDIGQAIAGRELPLIHRCRPLKQLEYILRNGCDADPTDNVISCAEIEKALEYGDSQAGQRDPDKVYGGVLMSFDASRLSQSSARVKTAALTPELQLELESIYPFSKELGGKTYFTRVAPNEKQFGSEYERDFGWFIPGDPFDALVALTIFGQENEVQNYVRDAIDKCTNVTWTL
jgi:hypothetical protein